MFNSIRSTSRSKVSQIYQEQKSPNYNKRCSDITNYNSNHKNEPRHTDRDRDQSPGMTSFQNYLIAKNSSPLSKMHNMKIPEESPSRQQNTSIGNINENNSRQGLNSSKMDIITQKNLQQSHYQEKPQNSQISISNQNKYLNLPNNNKLTTESPRIITNSIQPIQTNITEVNKPINNGVFIPPLQNLQNLPEDYIKIIQDIEDKRSRSRQRYQPSQMPQNLHSQIGFSSPQIQLGNQRQGAGFPQSINTTPTISTAKIIPQINSNPDLNVNYLESLYQNQIMQQKYPDYQDPRLAQLNQQIQMNALAPSNLNGLSLLQYYQQKFNLIQQSQLQLEAQQQRLYQELQQQYQSQSRYSPSPLALQPPVIQNQLFQTPPSIPQLQTQNLPGYPSPMRTYHTGSNHQFTPNPIERPPSSQSYRPNFTPQSSHMIRRNNDDLFKMINKEVLEDFESKKFTQIQNKYKQVTSISKDVQLRIQRDDQNRNVPTRVQFTGRQTAATYVQKHLRGYIIRKRFKQFVKIYYFFKGIERKTFINDLVTGIKDSFTQIKNIKTTLLKNYVNHCAIRIQKIFKAYYTRKYLFKIKKAFAKKEHLLVAAVIAWRLRKIMKTKEVENLVQQIKDFSQAMDDLIGDFSISERKMELQRGLEQSRVNTVSKLVSLVNKMQQNGLWLMYKQMEKGDRKNSLAQSSHQQQRDIFKVQRNRKALGSSYKGSNASNGATQSFKKDHYGYLTIENDQIHQRPSLPKNMVLADQGVASMQSTASFRNKQLNNYYASSNLQGPYYEQNSGRVNDSLQSIEEMFNTHTMNSQNAKNLNAYNDIPIKSFSKQCNTLSSSTLNMTNSRFEPNFQSEAYKNQAKEIFQRRMTYNPRQAASRSRERVSTNNTMNTLESPLRASPIKIQSVKQSSMMATINESSRGQNLQLPQNQQQRPSTRQSYNGITSQIPTYQQATQEINNERKNKFQSNQREEIRQDDMKPQNNKSEERKYAAGSRLNNDSRQGNHTVPTISQTPEVISRKLQRRTREERKNKDANNDSRNIIDPKQLDTNINMFDSSKANIYASNQSSTHGLFKKRQ